MELKDYAQKYNCEYPAEPWRHDISELKEKGIVVAYGVSDDLFELDGAILDEFDCYGDTSVVFIDNVFVPESLIKDFLDDVDDKYPMFSPMIEKLFENQKDLKKIEIAHGDGAQFTYKPNFPAEFFDITEDGNLYCKGFVFNIKDLKGE